MQYIKRFSKAIRSSATKRFSKKKSKNDGKPENLRSLMKWGFWSMFTEYFEKLPGNDETILQLYVEAVQLTFTDVSKLEDGKLEEISK